MEGVIGVNRFGLIIRKSTVRPAVGNVRSCLRRAYNYFMPRSFHIASALAKFILLANIVRVIL
jgi:hypothetical protein